MATETSLPPSVRVARGASYFVAQALIGNLIGVIYFAFATRILTPAEIGGVSALGLVSSLFVTFGTLAIPAAATRFISEYLGKGKPETARGICSKVLGFGVLISSFFSLSCFAASSIISSFISGGQAYQPLIKLLSLDVFVLLLSAFFDGVLIGLKKFKELALVGITLSLCKNSSSLFLLVQGLGLMGVVVGWVIGDFIGLAMFVFLTLTWFGTSSERKTYPFMDLVRYSTPLYASAILTYFLARIDYYIVLVLAGLTTLGIYGIALTVVSAVGVISTSVTRSLFPQLSEIYGRYGTDALKEASFKASRYVFLVYVPVTVGLAAIAYPTITLFFGTYYEQGWLPLAIVSIALALTCAGVIVRNLLWSLGLTRVSLEASVLAITVGTAFSALLVGPFKGPGAALARTILIFASFGYSTYRLRKVFDLRLDLSAFKKSLVSSAVMALVVVFVQLMWLDRLMLPLYVLVGAMVYVLMLRFLNAANEQDIELFHQFTPKRFDFLVKALAKFLGASRSENSSTR